MLKILKSLTKNKTSRILLTLFTSIVGVFGALAAVAQVLGFKGSLELFAYFALISGLVGSNYVWLREYLALSRLQDQANERLSQIKEVGLKRRQIDYETHIRSCTREICLWGLSLHSFSTTRMIELLVERLKISNALHLRILLLNPNSPFAEYRGQQKVYRDKKQDYLKETIQQSISQFHWMGNRLQQEFRGDIWKARCDIRLYDGYPSMGMVVFDDEAIVSHYLHGISGSTAPYVVYHRTENEHNIYRLLIEEFDEIWRRATSIFDMDRIKE